MRRQIALLIALLIAMFCSDDASAANAILREMPQDSTELTISGAGGKKLITIMPGKNGQKGLGIRLLDNYEFRIMDRSQRDDAEPAAADSTATATSGIKTSGMKPDKKSKLFGLYGGNIGFVEFGFNMLPKVDYSMYPDRSVDFMDLRIQASHHWMFCIFESSALSLSHDGSVQVSTGFQFGWNNYVLDNKIHLFRDNGRIDYYYPENYVSKTKLATFSVQVPVQFDFRITRSFYFSAGVYGGVNIASVSKVKHPLIKIRDPYMAPFYAGVSVHLSYDDFYIFCNYNFTQLFKDGRGPETNALTVGFGLIM